MSSRKAEGLSMTVMIVAVLGLLVLVLLGIAFGKRLTNFDDNLNSCPGYCSSTGTCASGYVGIPTTNCNDNVNPSLKGDGLCCRQLG